MDFFAADTAQVPLLCSLGRVATGNARADADGSIPLVPPGAATPSELRLGDQEVFSLPPSLVLEPAQEAFASAAAGLAAEAPSSLLSARAVYERGLVDVRLKALRRQARRGERRRKHRREGFGGGFWGGVRDESSGSSGESSSSEGEEEDDAVGGAGRAGAGAFGVYSSLSQKSSRRGRSRLGLRADGGAGRSAAPSAAACVPPTLFPSLLVAKPGRDERTVELLLLRERGGIRSRAVEARPGAAVGSAPAGGAASSARSSLGARPGGPPGAFRGKKGKLDALFAPSLACCATLPTRQTPRQFALLPPLTAVDASLAPGSTVRVAVRTMHELGIVGWRIDGTEEVEGDRGDDDPSGAAAAGGRDAPCPGFLPFSERSHGPRGAASVAPLAASLHHDSKLSARAVLPRSPATDLCCGFHGGGRHAHVALEDGRICEVRVDMERRGRVGESGGESGGSSARARSSASHVASADANPTFASRSRAPKPSTLFCSVAWRPPARWSERIATRLAGGVERDGARPTSDGAPFSFADPSTPLLPARRSSVAPRTLLSPTLDPRSLLVSATGSAAVADLRAPQAGGVLLEGVQTPLPGGPAAGALRGVGAGLGFSEGRDTDRHGEITALAGQEGAPFAAVAAEGGVVRLLDVRSPSRPLAAWDLSLLARPTWGWRAGLGVGPKGHVTVVERLAVLGGGASADDANGRGAGGGRGALPRLVAVVEGGAPLGARGWLLEAEAGVAPWWGPAGLGVDVDGRAGGHPGEEDGDRDLGEESGDRRGTYPSSGGDQTSPFPGEAERTTAQRAVTWRPVRPQDPDPLGPVPLFDARTNRRAEAEETARARSLGEMATARSLGELASLGQSPFDSLGSSSRGGLSNFAPLPPVSATLHRGRDTSLPSALEDSLRGFAVLPLLPLDLSRAIPAGDAGGALTPTWSSPSFPAALSSHALVRLSGSGLVSVDALRDPDGVGGDDDDDVDDGAGGALASDLGNPFAGIRYALPADVVPEVSEPVPPTVRPALATPPFPAAVALPATARIVEALVRVAASDSDASGRGIDLGNDARKRMHDAAPTPAAGTHANISAFASPPHAASASSFLPLHAASASSLRGSRASAARPSGVSLPCCDEERLADLLRRLSCPTTLSELWAAYRHGESLPAALPLAPRRTKKTGPFATGVGAGVREWAPELTAGRLLAVARGVEESLRDLAAEDAELQAPRHADASSAPLPKLFPPSSSPRLSELQIPLVARESLRAADAKLHSWARAPSAPALRQRGKTASRDEGADGPSSSGAEEAATIAAAPPRWFADVAVVLAEGSATSAAAAGAQPLARVLRHRVPPPEDSGAACEVNAPPTVALQFAPLQGAFPFVWPEGDAALEGLEAAGAAERAAADWDKAAALESDGPPPSDADALLAFAADWQREEA